MTADQDASARMYLNVGAVDVTNLAPTREGHGRMYLNVGSTLPYILVPRQPTGWGMVLDPGMDQQPVSPDAYTRMYLNVVLGSSYTDQIMGRSPLVYWKFDETGGDNTTQTAVDASGNARNGTISSSSYRRARIVAGTDLGYAVESLGGNSRVATAHATWMNTTAITAIVIHQPAAISTGYLMSIDDGGSGNSEMVFDVLRMNDGTWTTQHRGASGVVTLAGGTYSAQVPYVIGYTLSAAGEFLYINGAQVLSGPGEAPLTGTGQLRVANLNGTAFPGTGLWDEFALFGTALSAADHLTLANAALLTKYWPNTGSLTTSAWKVGLGATTDLTALPTGSTGKAASASGTTYLARTEKIPTTFLTGAPQTIELWFTHPGGGGSPVRGTLFKIDASSKALGWGVGLGGTDWDSNGYSMRLLREGIAWTDLGTPTAGTHHLVVTRSGTTFQVYLDGTSIYNAAPGSINEAVAANGMAIGGYTTRNLASTIKVDKVALYDSILSGARVTAHYNGGAGSDAAVAADAPIVLLELDSTTTTPPTSAYANAVTADAPIAWWRLNGNGNDSSGNGRTLTLDGTPAYAGSLLTGDTDLALGGTSPGATRAWESWMTPTGGFSWECWFKTAPGYSGILALPNCATGGTFGALDVGVWRVYMNGGAIAAHTFYEAGHQPTAGVTSPATTYGDGNRHHVVVTLAGPNAGDALTLYIDGASVGSATQSSAICTHQIPFYLGRMAANFPSPSGAVFDEVAIYATALSAARVTAHYVAGTT